MKRKKPKKEFKLAWVLDSLERDSTFCTKRMFGCLVAYVQGRMVMVLAEDPGERSYRGRIFAYDIWNGIMLPTEREFHASLIREFKSLKPHPVLAKWLYLPVTDRDFETLVSEFSDRILAQDPRFGIEPQIKVKRT